MNRIFPCIGWALVSSGLVAAPEGWAVPGAPWRVALHAQSAPGAPQAGWEIRLPDFGRGRADMRDAVLLDPEGNEIALDGIWRGPGSTLLMLAETMPDEKPATLYFGGNHSRRMKSWSATRSLLLETRRMPANAQIGSYGAWQRAWNASNAVDGAAFVPLVFHGGNPFGDESRYLSRYTGLIQAEEDMDVRFYTLSDDVSYVMINGRPVLQWTENHPPPRDPGQTPMTAVRLRKGLNKVIYQHAAVEAPGAMALGWDRGEKPGNVPPDAWVHPGKVNAGDFESADGAPVPLATLEAVDYLGFGGHWYVRVKASIGDPGGGWQVEWRWDDGRIDHGPSVQRLWMSLDPLRVVLRLKNGARVIEGRRVLAIPRDLPAASVNHRNQLKPFIDLLEQENASGLPSAEKKAGFILASDFLSSAQAAHWAEAWLQVAKPDQDHWPAAMTLAIREMAKADPQAALARLGGLSDEERKPLGIEAGLMELDIRVFRLNDPMAMGLAQRLSQSPDKLLARMARIRLGDYHLLNGRAGDAARCYADAVPVDKESARKAPVIDRARSRLIEQLLERSDPAAARAKLAEWERERPMAKIDGDQLLWRARVEFLAGDFHRSLQDLETSLSVRHGAPEEIEVRFWQGRALHELGRTDEAREIWQTLMKDYPKHERAEAAKSWLEKQ